MTYGEKLRIARKEKGLTQKALGELCGIAEPTIRRYESGNLHPKYETRKKIADALGMNVLDFVDYNVEDRVSYLYGNGSVYEGDTQGALFFANASLFKALVDVLEPKGVHFDPSDRSFSFDGEKYYISAAHANIIVNSTIDNVKNIVRAIGANVPFKETFDLQDSQKALKDEEIEVLDDLTDQDNKK